MCECFFITQRALHIGVIPAVNTFTKILSDLNKQIGAQIGAELGGNEKLLKELNAVSPGADSMHTLCMYSVTFISCFLLPPSLPAVHADWNMLSAGPSVGPVHGSVLHHTVCVDRTLPRKMPRGTCTYIQNCFSGWEIHVIPPPLPPPPGGCVRSSSCREAAQGDVCSARVLCEGHGCLVPHSGPNETCLTARAAGMSLSPLSPPPPPPTLASLHSLLISVSR